MDKGHRFRRMGKRPSDPGVGSYRTTGTPCSCSYCDPHKWGIPKHSVLARAPIEDDE